MPKNQAIPGSGTFWNSKTTTSYPDDSSPLPPPPFETVFPSLHRTCSNSSYPVSHNPKLQQDVVARYAYSETCTRLGPLLDPHLGAAVVKLTLSQLMSTPGNDTASPQARRNNRGQLRVLTLTAASSAPVMWTRAPSSALPATVPGLPLPASRYGITPPFPGMRPCYAHHPGPSPPHKRPRQIARGRLQLADTVMANRSAPKR